MLWPCPSHHHPLNATIEIPASKSLTNRALLLSALADGPSCLRSPLISRDTLLMVSALRELGVIIDIDDPHNWVVTPPVQLQAQSGAIDCGLAGTVMRFVPVLAALAQGSVRFDGDQAARVRPMKPVLEGLRSLGVQVDEHGQSGHLPFTVHGQGCLRGGKLHLDASASSQFVSAFLLAGARMEEGLDLRLQAKSPSTSHLEMSVECLRRRGVEVKTEVNSAGTYLSLPEPVAWQIAPGPIRALDSDIEPDLSNAGPFLAAALVCGGQVRVRHWPRHTSQVGDMWRKILPAMGARVVRTDGDLIVIGTGQVCGIDIDLHDGGELVPTVSALAALAVSPSNIRGIGHIRGHETDRIEAIATQIRQLGGKVRTYATSLLIEPSPLHEGTVCTYQDHRMATLGAIIGLSVAGVNIDDIEVTSKTISNFPALWHQLLGITDTPLAPARSYATSAIDHPDISPVTDLAEGAPIIAITPGS